MRDLFIAALFFLGTHLGIPNSPLRGQLVAALGERPYRILYAAVALAALAWLVHAWKASPSVPLWEPGPAARLVALVLMPFACLLFVCALTQRNPTAIGQAPDPDVAEPARGITRITRHPFLWAVTLWAVAHLAANGDLAALVFFGSFAILALVGSVALDARCTEARLPGWGVFVQRTSNLPFLAILEGRQTLVLGEIGLSRVTAALALYVALIWLHPVLFGKAVVAPGWP